MEIKKWRKEDRRIVGEKLKELREWEERKKERKKELINQWKRSK